MYKPEKKFFNRHMQLTILNTSNPNAVNGVSSSWSDPLSVSHPGVLNAWRAFRYDSAFPTDLSNLFAFPNNQTTATATDADGRGYNDSPFALTVPQGVATGERIGRDISVVKDSWYFRFTFPRVIPGDDAQALLTPGTLAHQRFIPSASLGTLTGGNRDKVFAEGLPYHSYNMSQRPVRIRLVCIFERDCDSPGEFGFTCSELFESQYDIHSRFSRDQAQGYEIVFDQTRTCVLMDNLGGVDNTAIDASTQDDKSSAGPYECRFKVSVPPYLRRYEAVGGPDNTSGYEVITSGGVTEGGVAKGALTWYVFIEDVYCPTWMDRATPAINSYPRYGTPDIINIEVDRKTFWIDP